MTSNEHAFPCSLEGKTALITGATRINGIGAAIAQLLASMGAQVVLTGLESYDQQTGLASGSQDTLQGVANLVQQACSSPVVMIPEDLSLPDGPSELFRKLSQKGISPDLLICNAAFDLPAELDEVSAPLLDRHYEVNTRAVVLLCQQFARQFQAGSGGRIVLMTSGQGVSPMPESLPYVVTKSCADVLPISLAPTLALNGITINSVDPGPTQSGWMNPALMQELARQNPFRRVGEPFDAARLVAFLCTDAAQWISGQVIRSRGAHP